MAEIKETNRLEIFSDGVFAIAITLLILEIKIPPVESIHSVKDLWRGLFHLWPSYLAFVFSFGNILIIWMNHHRVFDMIGKSSPHFMYANGFLLLTVTFIPFPTALLAEYITTDYIKPAAVMYCFSSLLTNLAFIIWLAFLRKPRNLLNPDVDIKRFNASVRSTRLSLPLYLITTVIALWLPVLALALNFSLWVLWIVLSLRNYTVSKTELIEIKEVAVSEDAEIAKPAET